MPGSPERPSTEPSVLLVDDEAPTLGEFREWFELHGITCGIESDSRAALQRIVQAPEIKVVVTDLRMPGLSGAELIAQTRNEAGRQVRFIICSGYCDAGVRDQFADIPIFEKPVDPERLAVQVRHELGC